MRALALVLGVLLCAVAVLPWAWCRRPARHNQQAVPQDPSVPHAWVDEAVVLDLMRSALTAGASVPRALAAVAQSVPARQGRPLQTVVAALTLGADWSEAWRDAPAEHSTLRRALQPSWDGGVSPVPLLRQAAESIRRERMRRAREAAARLGVRLVLPLGLCLLPAFVLFGLVPVLLSTGSRLLGG